MKKFFRSKCINKTALSLLIASLCCTYTVNPSYCQQIITNGMTQTQVNTFGNTTTVTTNTIRGRNAFNSFSKFNVDSGKTVNLVVPGQSDALINIVKDVRTDINGTLNAIKNNEIGGKIYIVNPNGVVVGSSGVINVGSLNVSTPTPKFVNEFFTFAGAPSDTAVSNLISGNITINKDSQFVNNGKINAIDNIEIKSFNVTNGGSMYTDAQFKVDQVFQNIVNTNVYEGQHIATFQDGQIIITAAIDISNSTGDVNLNKTASLNADYIKLNAGRNVTNNAKGLLRADRMLRIDAGNTGSIGTIVDPINLKLNPLANVYLNAGNQIHVKELAGSMQLQEAYSRGHGAMTLSAKGNITTGLDGIIEGGDVTFTSETGSVGDLRPIYVDQIDNLHVTAINGNINVSSSYELNLGLIDSNNNVTLRSNRNISDFNTDQITIWGNRISLWSLGSIGTADNPVTIGTNFLGVNATGDFSAFSTHDTNVYQPTNSDLKLGFVDTRGTANIKAKMSIIAGNEIPQQANIRSDSINLVSSLGSIGSFNSPLRIQQLDELGNLGGTGSLNALAANGNIYMNSISGNMRIGEILTFNECILNSTGNIIATQIPDNHHHISARNVTINAEGNVGSEQNPLKIRSVQQPNVNGDSVYTLNDNWPNRN